MLNFQESFYYDDIAFSNLKELADYIAEGFKKGLSIIEDGSLFALFQKECPDFYNTIIEATKDFEYKENVLTLTLYMMDNALGIVTPNHRFQSNYDIANTMKKIYPEEDQDVKVLFYDKVLAQIFWNEYKKTSDSRFKRNYTFMLHIYENRMYTFTYYYYLFLHLDKNETIRFTLDGNKMKSVAEITNYLSVNIDRAPLIVDEILHNPFILALIAINSGIDVLSTALASSNTLEILKCLSTYSNVDLTPIIKRRMAYWLLSNYQNYNYETEEAKALLVEYGKINRSLRLESIGDYVNVYDKVSDLYQKFVKLFDHNKIVQFRHGITSTDEYYLAYRYNDEYVCEKFLKENNLFNEQIHTELYRIQVEREILVDALEDEKKQVLEFKHKVYELTDGIEYDKKNLIHKEVISTMFLILSVFTLVCSFFVAYYKPEGDINRLIHFVVYGLLGISFIFFVFAFFKTMSEVRHCELIEVAKASSDVSVKTIEEEEETTLNPSCGKEKHITLSHLELFRKNRVKDLKKIEKISHKKPRVPHVALKIGALFFVIPFIEIVTLWLLGLFGKNVFMITVNGWDFNLLTFAYFVLNTVFIFVFRKKNFPYYLIYAYLLIAVLLSVFLH